MIAKHYYEAHVTIEPIHDEQLDKARTIAEESKFKIAHLLMKNREKDTEERSSRDTFMTAHDKDYDNIVFRTFSVVRSLKAAGFKVWRYKIEDIVVDSRITDEFDLLGEQNEQIL
jgi:hypothetical protein